MNKKITIACMGMTHLGLLHAAAFAEKGFNLICYDENKQLIQSLQKNELPVSEPKLDELVEKNAARLQFTDDVSVLRQCDLIFIACDVPTDSEGNSDLSIIYRLIDLVKPVLSSAASLILLSQVPPGFMRKIDVPQERLFYQVETLIFGNAVARALYPERYIIGVQEVDRALPDAYLQLLATFNCPILKMRYESAELAKISINMFLVSSVSTTNVLAEICENIGANWQEIAPALRLDKRIGQSAYLNPGLGIAGGNLERDLNTIIKLGALHKTDTRVVSAWLDNSKHRRNWVLTCLEEHVLTSIKNPLICTLGLAYKENTHSIKNSPSIALLQKLTAYQIKSHDPVVVDNVTHAKQQVTIAEAIHGADVVIIMTPWDHYRNLSLEFIHSNMKGSVIIDPYQVLKFDEKEMEDISYFTLGKQSIKKVKEMKNVEA